MHEALIAGSLLEMARQRLEDTPNAQAVTKIAVLTGEFRDIDAGSLVVEFDNLKKTFTGCEKCSLTVDMVEAEALCAHSEHRFRPSPDNAYCCPECGRGIGRIIRGKELDVVNITLAASRRKAVCPQQRKVPGA